MQQSSSNLTHFSHSLNRKGFNLPKVDSLTKSPAEFWKANFELGIWQHPSDGWKFGYDARSLQATFPLKNSWDWKTIFFLSLLGFGNFSGVFLFNFGGGRGTIFCWKAFVCVDLFSLRFFLVHFLKTCF